MLKNDVRIKNIALDVGYTDAQAFTRAFKRYEGITPSQYKELISKMKRKIKNCFFKNIVFFLY